MDYLLSPTFKSHLENAYYVAGVFLAVAAVFGILQYWLTRGLARTAAKREAYKLAAEKCELFASNIVPLYQAILDEIEAKKIQFAEHTKIVKNDERIAISLSAVTEEDVAAVNAMKNQPGELLNRLESFSLYFVSGVAADLPGFLTVGCLYCDIVREMFPFMASLSDEDPSYEHAKTLYVLWQQRRESMQLIKQHAELEIKLKKSKSRTIPSIGA